MGHDQRFKEFLHEFLQDFLKLFYPDVEAQLDFRNVKFHDKEVFTDFAEGSRREADIVAELGTHEGRPELVVIHVEVQFRRERGFEARMFTAAKTVSPQRNIACSFSGGRSFDFDTRAFGWRG